MKLTITGEKQAIMHEKGSCFTAALSLSKIPFGAFRQISAVCCVHNLFVYSEQIPHLQPDMCFCPRTRRGQKPFPICFPLTREILRSFFYSLSPRFSTGALTI